MNFKKYLFAAVSILLVVLIFFLGAVFLRYRSWTSDTRPAEKLTAYFSSMTKSDFRYQSLEWRLLPFPSIRFTQPVFNFKSDLKHELKANLLELRLDLVQLLFGKFGFSKLHLSQGVWNGQVDAPKGLHGFLVDHIDLKTSALRSDRPVKIYMSGDSGGKRKAVVIHGELQLPPFEEPRLDSLGFKVQVLTRNFRFEDSPEWELLGWIPSSGPSDFLIELKHDPLNDRIEFSGNAGLRDLVFRGADRAAATGYKAGNLQLGFAGFFSPKTDELKFTKCSANLPFAQFNMQGAYLPHRREFRSMTFSFINFKLDDLHSYFPDLKNKIPYFIGFSGLAHFSFALNGFPNHLKIYGDFDLTQTLFTYGRFFQKPKEKPFRLKTDMAWTAQVLTGDFSGSFDNLTFKGNLPEWRPSGETKVNFITNAFAAEQLSNYIPFLSSYDLAGNMKFFASFEGNLQKAEPFQKMFNLNLKKGKILRKGTGSGFKDLDLDVDFSPMLMEAKSAQFSLGGSFFEAVIKGIHPEKNPQWEGRIASEKLVASNVWNEWKGFWGGENAAWLESLHPWVRKMITSNDPFESLQVSFLSENGHSQVQSLEVKAFDGSLSGSASSKMNEAGQPIQIQATGAGMDASRLFKFLGNSQAGLEGRVNWHLSLGGALAESSTARTWTGPFSLAIEKGTLHHFDYVQAFEKMETLKKSALPAGDRLTFSSLNLIGKIEDEKLKVQDLKLLGDQVQIQGEGEMNGEGVLNFRLKTHLEAKYFRELFPKRADDFIGESDPFFGPVTLLASGPLDGLNLKPDPQSVASLAAYYARKKTQSISRYL